MKLIQYVMLILSVITTPLVWGEEEEAAPKIGFGEGRSDWTKLGEMGEELVPEAATWRCVRDNLTDLVWEVKSDSGLYGKDTLFRWGGVGALIEAKIKKQERYNDWDELVNGANRSNLCGFSDWRVPSKEELMSLTHKTRTVPAIDQTVFPNTVSSWYWSASPIKNSPTGAWAIYFDYAYEDYGSRNVKGRIRLVRGSWVQKGEAAN